MIFDSLPSTFFIWVTLNILLIDSFRAFPSNILKNEESLSPYWNDDRGPPPQLNLNDFNETEFLVSSSCPTEKHFCNEYEPYRSIDGFCNNKIFPSYGSAESVLSRLLPPVYDGMMRTKSLENYLLPNPRVISNAMKSMKRRTPKWDVNVFWLLFAQFVDHDFVLTPKASDGDKELNCSSCFSWKDHFACAPISIPDNDLSIPPFHPNGQRNCIPFVRSSAFSSIHNGLPSFEQINQNTAFLDLSMVYGSDKCRENRLRLFLYGQLIELKHPLDSKGMPPRGTYKKSEDCDSSSRMCSLAGDSRVNENVGLFLFHTLFLREHNRIARKLYEINKHWSDERIFQEARRINIALYQRILYEDFLPNLLNERTIRQYGLKVSSLNSYSDDYDEFINPQVLTEFSAAAFRVGHTMLPNHFIKMNKFYLPKGSLSLDTILRNLSTAYDANLLEDLTRGFISLRIESVDPIIERNLIDRLFIIKSNPVTGQDLNSINIARGRDHGLPGYTAYRERCGLTPIYSWNDMKIHKEDLSILKNIYSSVHDIDLFVGGLVEIPQEDSLVGPTFSCIIAIQFTRAKKGDRFWFENSFNKFRIDQLRTIKEGLPMNRILHNFENSMYLPTKVFNLPDKNRNPLITPKYVRDINFNLWKEENPSTKVCHYKDKTFQPQEPVFISNCLRCFCDPINEKITCTELYYCNKSHNDEFCKLTCGT